jgi:hypothetical protein
VIPSVPAFRRRGAARLTLAAALCAALTACAPIVSVPTPEPPAAETAEPSEESRRLAAYYASVQRRLLSQGLLRTDGGGGDTPLNARMLAENFERIALYDEYALRNGRFVQQQTPSRLRRWVSPIRMRAVFGASVDPGQRAEDRANLAEYVARIERVTGHRIVLADDGPANFLVLFLNRDEQKTFGPRLSQLVPRISPAVADEIASSPRSTFCAAYALSEERAQNAYTAAIVLVKAEHPDLLRLSCIHEEVAQAMGLANDSPQARPSIFNDDEEFALLTRHDELLLKMLYDPRLKLGMTPAEARPTVQRIAREYLGGES